jgi:hypothetical protein
MNLSDKEKIESSLNRIKNNQNNIYILTYDTKTNPRASVKYIYDLALTLMEDNFNVTLIVEDKTYNGVSSWLGEEYDKVKFTYIKDEKLMINVDDTLIVPEYYSNALEQLKNIRCTKIMLVQQKEYIFETLPIGSKWSHFGFNRVITTTEATKKYILEYFPESIVHIIPPIIGDNFKPTEDLIKPFIAISCRDRSLHKKIISEFYVKYPHLRWITFRDMVQMSYDEFSTSLKECLVSVWCDEDSTFGTFPLESIKSGVPVIGLVPKTQPDWMGENGFWVQDYNKLNDVLGSFVTAWLNGVEFDEELKTKMSETILPYDTTVTKNNIKHIFESLKIKTIEKLEETLEKIKE